MVILVIIRRNRRRRKKRRERSVWVKTWLQNRDAKSAYANILTELRCQDKEEFRKYLRMNTHTWQVCLGSYTLLIFLGFETFNIIQIPDSISILDHTGAPHPSDEQQEADHATFWCNAPEEFFYTQSVTDNVIFTLLLQTTHPPTTFNVKARYYEISVI